MLLKLLDTYGEAELEAAVVSAQERRPHPHAVRHVLEKRRQTKARIRPALVLLTMSGSGTRGPAPAPTHDN
jgi:hypothetical protein